MCAFENIFLEEFCDASRCAKTGTENDIPSKNTTENVDLRCTRRHVIYNVVKLSVRECLEVFIFVSLSVISILEDPAGAKVFVGGVYEYFNCAVLRLKNVYSLLPKVICLDLQISSRM